ncbi:AEC family transporter [Bermanella marisrubri]|uniref:Predicted Permease n=1 Tax=Bermanella marisrubri TaxID=207949 RepID=Q1N4Y9_9GAMM|nr:AEC family transporter [Bermanella marisrubri]EAT13289.1 predicted Permease [Oceanobacter sp. RED65] [Bermanella marisrubri]QIZ84052.1 AEC family transporter [Bermanella marisrubri]
MSDIIPENSTVYWLKLDYFSALSATLAVTAPVFIIIFFGLFLKLKGQLNSDFVTMASRLVFNWCLPFLIFVAMLDNPINVDEQWHFILTCMLLALISFVVIWWASMLWVEAKDRGVAVQGAFRSNLGIIGLALCENAFGQAGLALGAVMLAVVTPVFNVLSIWGLNQSLKKESHGVFGKALLDTVKNPLIIAILLGFIANWANVTLPVIAYDALSYLADMTLPLALLVIGASMSLSEFRQTSGLSLSIVFVKLVFVPVFAIMAAYFMGYHSVELGCIAVMFASPTATASFVMVRSIGGNHVLASNIIVISTLFALLSVSLWLYGLHLLALI